MMYLRRIFPHVLIGLAFIVIALLYFNPVLSGKKILQSDIVQYSGMAKQQQDFKDQTGIETYWTNSAFGGMPTYQLGAQYPHNYVKALDLTIRFLPRPADYLFLYFIGFYILMLTLKVNFKLAALGALAFGFSTYLIIILGVGHNSKAHAIAYMPLVLSGIILLFRKKYIFGFLLTTIALALEICANHPQMTYYLMLLCLILVITYGIDAFQKKELPHFFKTAAILIPAIVLAMGLNASNILATKEYAKQSTRGANELTITADGSPKAITSGLSKDYITEYSYGFLETLNLYIPRILGGSGAENVGVDSATYQFFINQGASPVQAKEAVKNMPAYWGDQPIVAAPAYIGAVVIFLFVMALFLVKGRLKWWLLGGVITSLLLSYGKNLSFLTDFFIDYVPLYSKFRAVSSIQVLLELCIPVLAVFGLVRLFNQYEKDEIKLKALKYAFGITAGLAVLFVLFKSTLFDFVGANDGFYRQNYGTLFIDALRADRAMLFTQDTLRSLMFVILSAGIIYGYLKKKIAKNLVILSFTILIVTDLVLVGRRYVNNDHFVSALSVNKPFQPNAADTEILKDTTHFRVFDVTDNSARASYFHNSLSGYHAAKLRRYNELFEFHIQKNNTQVLNMLNTKYIIAQDDKGGYFAYTNTDANGNAWFIKNFKTVQTANAEILALDSLNTKKTAILNETQFDDIFKSVKTPTFQVDSTAQITVKTYQPNYIKYQSENKNNGFAVFSEIFYPHGWQAYIDGNPVEHIRVNYVLRGMNIPAGKHIIEFKFEPKVVKTGSNIALASSVLFGLLAIIGIWFGFKRCT